MSLYYFQKEEGKPVKSVNDVLSHYFNGVFISKLGLNELINIELENKYAYIEVEDKLYINHTYAWRAPTLKSIEQTLDLFLDRLIDKCKPFNESQYKVSIRYFNVDYNEVLEEFTLLIRFTIIDHPEFTQLR